jgi:hypothetical protein
MAESRRKFDADFREGAVRLVRETAKPIAAPGECCQHGVELQGAAYRRLSASAGRAGARLRG